MRSKVDEPVAFLPLKAQKHNRFPSPTTFIDHFFQVVETLS